VDFERALSTHLPTGSFELGYTAHQVGYSCGTFIPGKHTPEDLRDMIAAQAPSALSQRLRKFKDDPDFFVCSRVFTTHVPDIDTVKTLVKAYKRDRYKNVCYAVSGRLKVTIIDQGSDRFGVFVNICPGTSAMKVTPEEYTRRTGVRSSLLDRFLD
jgi:hypothetical protein